MRWSLPRPWVLGLPFFVVGFAAAYAQHEIDDSAYYETYVPFQLYCFFAGLSALFIWTEDARRTGREKAIGRFAWIALALASAYCLIASARS